MAGVRQTKEELIMNRISASKKMLQGRLTPVTVWGGRVLGNY